MLDRFSISGPLVAGVLVIIISVLFYWYSTRNFDYWSKRNLPFVKPTPFVGSVGAYAKRPIHEVDEERYKRYGRLYGTFEGTRPFLMIGDPVLLRDIMVKDFNIFPNRRPLSSGDPIMDKNVSSATGEDWKRIRTIITPTFSTGKIKRMMGIFKECSETVIQNFKKATRNGEPVELKRIFGAFTMDVIASSAFSTKLDSHNDPENEFVRMATLIFRPKFNWRVLMYFLFPNFVKFMGISIFPPNGINFFRDVTLNIIAQRKKTGQTRNDFLQLLMDTAKELSQDLKSETKEKEAEDMASMYGGVSTDYQVFKNVAKKAHSFFFRAHS
ncbi:unnamed protein product [Larinioides sclopetarius]|uniref:Cytochrome P450 n=1 Tax=Larinioides sclopetarius TaxID=280406 RepID=A0AAV2AL67_9ARAC